MQTKFYQIPLTQKQVALVDKIDFSELNKYKWYAHKKSRIFYAMRMVGRRNNRKIIPMHTAIMKTPKGMEVDHKDGNGLNNQRNNLRICSHAENSRNKGKHIDNFSGYKGVCWHKQTKKWIARIMFNNKAFHLVSFLNKEKAYNTYIKACRKYHGDFAKYV